MYFSNNLSFLRKQLGETQGEMAEKMSIKRSSWGSYEADNTKPTLEGLTAIYFYFKKEFKGINLDDFLFVDLQKKYRNDTAALVYGVESDSSPMITDQFIDLEFISKINKNLEALFSEKLKSSFESQDLDNKVNELIAKCWDVLLHKHVHLYKDKSKLMVMLAVIGNTEIDKILKNQINSKK